MNFNFISQLKDTLDLQPKRVRLSDLPTEERVDYVYTHKRAPQLVDCFMKDILDSIPEAKNWSATKVRMYAVGDLLSYLTNSAEDLFSINAKIASPKNSLTRYEKQMLEITLDLLKQYPESTAAYFDEHHLFSGLLFKGQEGRELLTKINQIEKNTPESCLFLATNTIRHKDLYSECVDDLLHYIDTYLETHFSRNSPAKILKTCPEYASAILYYLENADPNEYKATVSLFQKCDTLPIELQKSMWKKLYKNASFDKLTSVIHTFLSSQRTPESSKEFYRLFLKNVPVKSRQKILALASDKQKINYLKLLQGQKLDITKVKIHDPLKKESEFLIWHLLNNGKISSQEVSTLIQNIPFTKQSDPSKKTFLFHDKEVVHPDIFITGCKKMSPSVFHTLRWISSFRNTRNFSSWLAVKWPELPESIRLNPNIILAMDNKFGLMYRTAERGDTGTLNEIKRALQGKNSELAKRLTSPDANGNTILHLLCSQGKKGILKLIENFSLDEQNILLNTQNNAGQTPIDCCSADFKRFMEQKSFTRPKSKEPAPQIIEQPIIEEIPTTPVPEQKKKKILRNFISLNRFESDVASFENNEKVSGAIQKEIKALRTMSNSNLSQRIGHDLGRDFKSRVCVADINANGSAYRMGYVVQKGTLGFLFVMSHQDYDNEFTIKEIDKMAMQARQLINQRYPQPQNY